MATQAEIDAIYSNRVGQLAYEGASESYKSGQRGLIEGDPDTLASRELLNLQMRSEHAVRNNGTAKASQNVKVISLSAVKVNWKAKDGTTHELMQELWDEFEKNPNLDGHGTLRNTQAIWNYSIGTTGNAYTRQLIRKANNSNRVPLKLQTIPSRLHDILYNGENSKDNIKNGIKFSDSKPVTYYFREGLYNQHWFGIENTFKHVKVPAKDIIHIFERTNAGQWLGVPDLSSVLITLYELDELTDATIAKQKAAQAVSWIIENTNPLAMTPIGVAATVKDKEGIADKIITNAAGGGTQYMQKGEKIHFSQGTDIGANLPVLIKKELEKIASSLQIPYHLLTGDTEGLDFSSIRAVAIQYRQVLEYIHQFRTIPLGLAPVTDRFKDLASLRFNIKDAVATYQLPRWYGVDDLKDSQANLLDLSMGTTTIQRLLDERHLTIEEVIDGRAMLEKAGLGHLMESKADASKQITNNEANVNSAQ